MANDAVPHTSAATNHLTFFRRENKSWGIKPKVENELNVSPRNGVSFHWKINYLVSDSENNTQRASYLMCVSVEFIGLATATAS